MSLLYIAAFTALACSIAALGVSVVFALRPPEATKLRRLTVELAELGQDIEHLAQLHHKGKRRENVELAVEGRKKSRDVLTEAAELISARPQQAANVAAPPPRPLSRAELKALAFPDRRH